MTHPMTQSPQDPPPSPGPVREPEWMRRLGAIADDLWQRGDHATSSELHTLRTQIVAQTAPADRPPLSADVEHGRVCFHGTPGGCSSYRCGSNCSQRFDRSHPCPACLIANIRDLRAAVTALGGDPYALPAPPSTTR